MRTLFGPGLSALAVLLVAGCGSSQDQGALAAAQAFYAAVAAGDGEAACALLSPRTESEVEQSAQKPCPQAILEEEIPPGGEGMSVRAYGTMAQVRSSADTAFLSDFAGGWKIVAVACKATQEALPYDCQVKGG